MSKQEKKRVMMPQLHKLWKQVICTVMRCIGVLLDFGDAWDAWRVVSRFCKGTWDARNAKGFSGRTRRHEIWIFLLMRIQLHC